MSTIWKASLTGVLVLAAVTVLWVSSDEETPTTGGFSTAQHAADIDPDSASYAVLPDDDDRPNHGWAARNGKRIQRGVETETGNTKAAYHSGYEDGFAEVGSDAYAHSDEPGFNQAASLPFAHTDDDFAAHNPAGDGASTEDDVQEYEAALKEAYTLAKESGDQDFLIAVMGQMRELNTIKQGSVATAGSSSGSSSQSSDSAQSEADTTQTEQELAALDPINDPEIEGDCQRDLTVFGEFQCPCPSDDLYNPRWREAYNPDFLSDKNCRY